VFRFADQCRLRLRRCSLRVTRSGSFFRPVSRFHSSNVFAEIFPLTSSSANFRRCARLFEWHPHAPVNVPVVTDMHLTTSSVKRRISRCRCRCVGLRRARKRLEAPLIRGTRRKGTLNQSSVDYPRQYVQFWLQRFATVYLAGKRPDRRRSTDGASFDRRLRRRERLPLPRAQWP
jgi:hypothetical protein